MFGLFRKKIDYRALAHECARTLPPEVRSRQKGDKTLAYHAFLQGVAAAGGKVNPVASQAYNSPEVPVVRPLNTSSAETVGQRRKPARPRLVSPAIFAE